MFPQAALGFALAAMPMASAQLNTLAKANGLKYFGTATDNYELANAPYLALLSNTSDFGQITPSNMMKVKNPLPLLRGLV